MGLDFGDLQRDLHCYFEGGGGSHKPRDIGSLKAGKGKEGVSHGASRRRHSHGNILILAQGNLCLDFATTEM